MEAFHGAGQGDRPVITLFGEIHIHSWHALFAPPQSKESYMKTWFELWDAENASLIGTFDTQSAALRVVRDILESSDSGSAATLVLTRESTVDEDPRVLGSGEELVELAYQARVAPFAGLGRVTTVSGTKIVGRQLTDRVTITGTHIGSSLNEVGEDVRHEIHWLKS